MAEQRFFVVPREVDGEPGHALVKGVPDPLKPDDPDRDARTGETMFEGTRLTFWPMTVAGGYRWVDRGYHKRCWIHAPKRKMESDQSWKD